VWASAWMVPPLREYNLSEQGVKQTCRTARWFTSPLLCIVGLLMNLGVLKSRFSFLRSDRGSYFSCGRFFCAAIIDDHPSIPQKSQPISTSDFFTAFSFGLLFFSVLATLDVEFFPVVHTCHFGHPLPVFASPHLSFRLSCPFNHFTRTSPPSTQPRGLCALTNTKVPYLSFRRFSSVNPRLN